MQIFVMDADSNTSYHVSRLLYEKHIYNALPDHYRDVWGAHILLQEIEFGYRTVFGFVDDSGDLCGVVHGKVENDAFVAHLLFQRNVDVAACLLAAESVLLQYYSQHGIEVKYVEGFIPEFNRAALRTVKRYGMENLGLTCQKIFRRQGEELPTIHFRKEIK